MEVGRTEIGREIVDALMVETSARLWAIFRPDEAVLWTRIADKFGQKATRLQRALDDGGLAGPLSAVRDSEWSGRLE